MCTKEQLLKIIEYYNIDIGDKNIKEEVKPILKSILLEKKVLTEDPSAISPGTVLSLPLKAAGLTFDHQELLMLQLDHDKFQLKADMEKELAVEKMLQHTEQAK